jgi:hypothetical protein
MANDPLKTDLALADLAQPYQAQQSALFSGEQTAQPSVPEQPAVEASVPERASVSAPKVQTAKVARVAVQSSRTRTTTSRATRTPIEKKVTVARSVTPRPRETPRQVAAGDATPARRPASNASATSNGTAEIDESPVPARTTYGTSNGSVAEGNEGAVAMPAARNGRNTVRSAVIGAGAGAVLGAVVNRDNRGRGAVIGGAAGAILGAVIGNNTGSQR